MHERIKGLTGNARNASVAFKSTENNVAFRKFHKQLSKQGTLNMIDAARNTITTDTSRGAIKLRPREFYENRPQSMQPSDSFARKNSSGSRKSSIKKQDTMAKAEYMDHVSEIDSEFFSGENSPAAIRRRSTQKIATPYQSRKRSTTKKKKNPYSNQKSTPYSNKHSTPRIVTSFNASFDSP